MAANYAQIFQILIFTHFGINWVPIKTYLNDIGSTTDLIEKILALKVTCLRKALFYCEKQVPTPQLSQAATGERKDARTWNLGYFRFTTRVTFERNKKKIQEGHVGTFLKIWWFHMEWPYRPAFCACISSSTSCACNLNYVHVTFCAKIEHWFLLTKHLSWRGTSEIKLV